MVQPDTIQKLGRLLIQLNIKSAFFIDDYNAKIELSIVSGLIQTILNSGLQGDLKISLGDNINIDLPSNEIIIDDFSKNWDKFDEPTRVDVYKKVAKLQDATFLPEDYEQTHQLKEVFEKNHLQLISPEQWLELSTKLDGKVKGSDKVLLIFDQDLKQSNHVDFSSGRITGDKLILGVKNSPLWAKAYCVLITHTITSIQEEYETRKALASADGLEEKDFFPLSKKRIETPELLCDVIKKALLNGFFERIKSQSKDLIEIAQTKVLEEIEKIGTYDFDQSVLISSDEEGVWQVETLLRFANILYDEKIKEFMKDRNYLLNVNPDIKMAKAISDIRFKTPYDVFPYKMSDRLRRAEIYLEKELINVLHLPLENGDIFDVYEGQGKGKYILIGQECDLIVRNSGSREARYGTFLKIEEQEEEEIEGQIDTFRKKHGIQNHYLANKYILDFFTETHSRLGVVFFKRPIIVDLNILDLVVFNPEGEANTTNLDTMNPELLTIAWASRLKKLKKLFCDEKESYGIIKTEIEQIHDEVKESILKKLAKVLSVGYELGDVQSVADYNFQYGIKRIKRLRNPFANSLLNKYAASISRVAEMHNFSKRL